MKHAKTHPQKDCKTAIREANGQGHLFQRAAKATNEWNKTTRVTFKLQLFILQLHGSTDTVGTSDFRPE